jgi:Zn-dependent protease with chaperone function
MSQSFYPESPKAFKDDLTKLSGQYRLQIFINLIAILVFILVYLAMIVGSVNLIYEIITFPLPKKFNHWHLLLKFGMAGMAVMLFLFLLKFIFKKNSGSGTNHVEIKERDHPKLFQFIRQLSDEVGAPFPKKIFVNHEINASVFYNSTVFSLFFPGRKNLLIGLGLVNSINLSEFKAVIAHEFGHFAQSSMKLGSYVYMANKIIHDMVYERDKWDETLEKWQSLDVRFSIFAWLLMPIIWLVRFLMSLLYKGLNALHASLLRQMEFNADLVAVSVTGSNQIINGLYRLGSASEVMNVVISKLVDARDEHLFTNNIFHHQSECFSFFKKKHPAFRETLLEYRLKNSDTSEYWLFEGDKDKEAPQMYASHPSNFLRERNAKKNYVKGTSDDRSPWILFGNKDELAEKVTSNFYALYFGEKPQEISPASEVQKFIEQELSEGEFPEHYLGFYNSRNIHIPEEQELETLVNDSKGLEEVELWGKEFEQKMAAIAKNQNRIIEVVQSMETVDQKWSLKASNDSKKDKEALKKEYTELVKVMEKDHEWYKQEDTKVLTKVLAYYNENHLSTDELLGIYRFIRSLNLTYSTLLDCQNQLEEQIQHIISKKRITDGEIAMIAHDLRKIYLQVEELLLKADHVEIPRLSHVSETKLKSFLLKEQLTFISQNTLNFEKIQLFRFQLADIKNRLDRIYNKALTEMIKLHEVAYAPNQKVVI